MKITGIITHVVQIARQTAYGRETLSALGPGAQSRHGLVLIETDAGVTGIGEAASCFARNGHILIAEIDTVLAPLLVGEDPRDVTRLVRKMDATLFGSEPAKAAIEMALLDVMGKELGVPLYQLLGGKMRDAVSLSYSIPFGNPDEMAEFAAELKTQGFRTVKAKVGQGRDRDIATVTAIRDAIGAEIRLRVDANMAMRNAKDAIGLISALEPLAPELIEQPLPPGQLAAMAEVRQATPIPILADESVWAPRDAANVISMKAADAINVYVAEAGGVTRAQHIFSMCESFGLGCLIGSMPEMGVATAAQMHLGVAVPNLDYHSDACGHLYHQHDVLATELRVEDGRAFPPEAPGLGVELDMAAVERYSI